MARLNDAGLMHIALNHAATTIEMGRIFLPTPPDDARPYPVLTQDQKENALRLRELADEVLK